MFGLSMTEVVIILGLALLLLGPDQLPSIAKTLGKGMREIRKATDDLKSTFDQEMVRLDEPEPPRLQPVSADPAAARANARAAALSPADPASARAAARRAAAGPDAVAAAAAGAVAAPDPSGDPSPALRLVPPDGIVAREAAKLEATTLVEPPASDASAPATPVPSEGVKDAK